MTLDILWTADSRNLPNKHINVHQILSPNHNIKYFLYFKIEKRT